MATAVSLALERATKQLGFCLRRLRKASANSEHLKDLADALRTLTTAKSALYALDLDKDKGKATVAKDSVVTLDLLSALDLKTLALPAKNPDEQLTLPPDGGNANNEQASDAKGGNPLEKQYSAWLKPDVGKGGNNFSVNFKPDLEKQLTWGTADGEQASGAQGSNSLEGQHTARRIPDAGNGGKNDKHNDSPEGQHTAWRTSDAGNGGNNDEHNAKQCQCLAHFDARSSYEKLLAPRTSRGKPRETAAAELETFLEQKSQLPGCQGEKAALLLLHARGKGRPRRFLRAKRHLTTATPEGQVVITAVDGQAEERSTNPQDDEDVNALLFADPIVLKLYAFKKTKKLEDGSAWLSADPVALKQYALRKTKELV
eukprot:TRINITY_DN7362_c1_g1_i3.p1 TRINITY_DN7362_c1_g1~~TRINITY_DN7362_c1_g1_i3.p1  ORF type:complete len:403 (+),score=87.55 TRINITY_DN7362_c1_g1_i3:96-1211(+)